MNKYCIFDLVELFHKVLFHLNRRDLSRLHQKHDFNRLINLLPMKIFFFRYHPQLFDFFPKYFIILMLIYFNHYLKKFYHRFIDPYKEIFHSLKNLN